METPPVGGVIIPLIMRPDLASKTMFFRHSPSTDISLYEGEKMRVESSLSTGFRIRLLPIGAKNSKAYESTPVFLSGNFSCWSLLIVAII